MKKNKNKMVEENIALIVMKGLRAALLGTGKRYVCTIVRDGGDDGIVEMVVKHPRYTTMCNIMVRDGCFTIMSGRFELADPNVIEQVVCRIKEFFGKRLVR